MQLDLIVEKHTKDLGSRLNSIFDRYIELTFRPQQFSNDEGIKIVHDTNDLLMTLASPFFEYGKFKDTWDTTQFYFNAFVQEIYFKSMKTNHDFLFGIDHNSIFLRSSVMHPENLKNMGDDFWRLFLQLEQFGDFSFVENAVINSKESQYFNNKRSNLFRILRNYFLHEVDNVHVEPYNRNYDMNLGWLEIRWPFGTPWIEIMKQGCLAFKTLYQIHYELWKVSDVREKKHARERVMNQKSFRSPAGL
jgi:hypothetical protein